MEYFDAITDSSPDGTVAYDGDGHYILPSGAQFYANNGAIGLCDDGVCVVGGHDGDVEDYLWPATDKIAMAGMMIARWTKYRANVAFAAASHRAVAMTLDEIEAYMIRRIAEKGWNAKASVRVETINGIERQIAALYFPTAAGHCAVILGAADVGAIEFMFSDAETGAQKAGVDLRAVGSKSDEVIVSMDEGMLVGIVMKLTNGSASPLGVRTQIRRIKDAARFNLGLIPGK